MSSGSTTLGSRVAEKFLERYSPQGRPLPSLTAISSLKQIAAALYSAHEQWNLIHRDIKPANMLILADEQIVLSDSGIALAAQSHTQQSLGRPQSMAPEQIRGHPVLASDQYSLWPVHGSRAIPLCSLSHPDRAGAGQYGQGHRSRTVKRPAAVFSLADALERAYQQESQRAQRTTLPLAPAAPFPEPGATTEVLPAETTPVLPTTTRVTLARDNQLLTAFRRLNREY